MTGQLVVPRGILEATLRVLQDAGREGKECVVLWLGTRTTTTITIAESYVPVQIASEDFFQIPRESIAALLEVLGARGLMVGAQVHTHPQEAFHSAADDRWAIVRHVGALSLVLPFFAQRTKPETFLTDAAVFRLSLGNDWIRLQDDEIDANVRGAS